jgi:hypothetical protein
MYTPEPEEIAAYATETEETPASQVSRRSLLRGAMMLGVGAAALGGTTLGLASPAHAVATPTIHSRGAWGARSPRGTIPILNYRPDKIVIHHTATGNVTDYSQSWAFQLSRAIQNWHMDNNGWADSGQQFTISRGGYIMEGRYSSLSRLQGGTSFPQGVHAPGANTSSIGIENEGTYTSVGPTTALWNSMVQMCAYICQQYGISPSRIYGHRDFSSTACPGNTLYSRLPQLRNEVAAALGGGGGGYSSIVSSTSSRFTRGNDWSTSSYSNQKYGSYYHFANPVLASDSSWFRFNIPSSGYYYVDGWWPANSGYNDRTPFVIVTSSGNQTVHASQRTNGGRWVNLGRFHLSAGDRNVVAVSRWTSGTGYVIADAIRIRS